MYNSGMSDSIFTKIIRGEIPCHKVYEDDKNIAFLDIHPVQPGMTLVVPTVQIDNFTDLTDADYTSLMLAVKKVAQHMGEVFPDKRIGVQIEGLDVPHVHVKLIPISSGDDFRTKPDTSSEPDHEALKIMAERLSF